MLKTEKRFRPRRLRTLPSVRFALLTQIVLTNALLFAAPFISAKDQTVPQWGVHELTLQSSSGQRWWQFPVKATFTHTQTGRRITLQGFWDGGGRWVIRFAPPLPGVWSYVTSSPDEQLDNHHGEVHVREPTVDEIAINPHYRGHVRISGNGRYFEYADGTPCFILADTCWSVNTARCGLGNNEDGPFFQYLNDREAKGFTTILMQYMRGFGDTKTERAGQRNEGGYPFYQNQVQQLNPAYFQYLDRRVEAISQRGFLLAIPTMWWGKVSEGFFDIQWAKRISAYLAVRYGAYNALWAISGEYQYVFPKCGWTVKDINALGQTVQRHNPYHHPVSIHPSGNVKRWKPPHNVQSSRAFHNSGWLDHNWLQTGQSIDRMYNIVVRSLENRRLRPARPVFCAESYYERGPQVDPNGAYHTRWQAWTAMLNGCAGYGYGAYGVWNFFTPDDPNGETGKRFVTAQPWRQALQYSGSRQLRPVRDLLTSLEWWNLEPHRERLTVNGRANPSPTAQDISPPHCAIIPGALLLAYIPRGNADRTISIVHLEHPKYGAYWYNPRNGTKSSERRAVASDGQWTLPPPFSARRKVRVSTILRLDHVLDAILRVLTRLDRDAQDGSRAPPARIKA